MMNREKKTGKYKKHRVQMRRLDRQREVITFYCINVLNLIASENLVTVEYEDFENIVFAALAINGLIKEDKSLLKFPFMNE